MNVDEIKASVSMREVVSKYGLTPNRAGFIVCPFHKEKTPSMKIYKNSFHCFGCGESGDVFVFVQKMDNLSFKEAYLSLGGEYKKTSNFSTRRKIQQAKTLRKKKEEKIAEIQAKRQDLSLLIEFYKLVQFQSEPLSDDWCMAINKLVTLWGEYEYLQEVLEEVGEKIELSANG